MPSYLIEVPHDPGKAACVQAFQIFVESGSHFLANADWGCEDDEHKAWLIVDVDTKEQALQIVPPRYRKQARIISLFKVTREDVANYKKGEKADVTDHYHS